MTTSQQLEMLQTKRLRLSNGRRRRYYIDTYIVSVLAIVIWFLIIKGMINKEGHYKSPYVTMFLVFPIMAGLLYIHQRRSLRLIEVETGLSKENNYQTVKATMKELKWKIKVDNKGFIEANTDNFGIFTWTDQMFTVVIADERILVNSICDVDTYATQAISWGQNSRNVKQFRRTFEKLMANKFS